MPQKTVKHKKATPNRIKLVAKNPRPLVTAIRAWVKASEKTDCDALNLQGAPAWVENALAEVTKVVLPGKNLPAEGEWDAGLLGELIGRQAAFARLFGGEIPMSAEMQAELGEIKRCEAALPKTPAMAARKKQLAKDFLNMADANTQAIPALLAAALKSSHEDGLKFQAGLLRGTNLASEELAAGNIFQRYTKIFWVLGTQWRRFSDCRSVAGVHRKLCAELGEKNVGSLKHFEERVAKKIGMRFGIVGRPSKLK